MPSASETYLERLWKIFKQATGWDGQGTAPASVTLSTSFGAGENHLGAVGGHTDIIDVTVLMTLHATYVANDFVGLSGVPLTFAGCARKNGGTGLIVSAELIDYALQSVAGELWLFNTPIVPPADSAAWTITDAELLTLVCVIPFSTYYASALNSASPVGNLTYPFKCRATSTSLSGAFVTRGAPAYNSGDVTFRLGVLQD